MPDLRRAESRGQCPDEACRYRQLYEGTQTSLRDMAAKQAAALQSLNLVKRRISDLIKQHFPDEHSRVERRLGHRFTDASDEVILTYLEQLVGAAISPLPGTPVAADPGGADLLRAALRRAGYPVGDDADLSAWASIVDRTAPPHPTTPTDRGRRAAEPTAEPGPTTSSTSAELDDLFTPPTGTAAPAPAATGGPPSTPDDGKGLDGLFGDTPSSQDPPPPDAAPAPAPTGDAAGLEDLFDTPPSPEQPTQATATGDADGDGLDFEDLFGDDTGSTTTQDTPPAAQTGPGAGGLDLEDLFGDDTATASPAQASSGGGLDDDPADPAPLGTSTLEDLFGGDNPTTATAEAPATGLEDLFGSDDGTHGGTGGTPASPDVTEQPGPGDEPAPGDGGWSAPPDAESLTVPIRPELVQTRSRNKRKPRKPRTRASRPDPNRDLDTGEDAPSVAPDLSSRIAAAVAIPRPMFSSDLVSVAGDRETLDAWSQEMLNLGAAAPVRFVGAKARHRTLGPLVLPHGDLRAAATEFDSSWWAQAMDRYHGSALYELAVLLSRVGDQVQATDLWDTAARFRLDTPRGLVGLVVHLSGGLGPDDLGRTQLDEALSGFSRERFTLVAVLNVVAKPAELDQLAEAVTEIAEQRQWRPAYPVVATHTWEWAANSGRTARLVLGG